MKSLILDKHWEFRAPSQTARRLSERLEIPIAIAGYLEDCGICTEDAARVHLEPELRAMTAPWLMKDMENAVTRLVDAVVRRELIGIFGDYDADGVTSTAIISLFFRTIGQPHVIYIPHRENEGYGLNEAGIRYLHSKGATLMVTVDCGITGAPEVEFAQSLGLDVIVTDHHEPGDEFPNCVAVLNPKRPDCPYPFEGLAGVGVAFNLIVALRAALRERGFFRSISEPNLKEFLDLVTIGTIGDIVPLVYENRIFTRTGLNVIRNSRRPGIQALLSECTVKGDVGVSEVAFRLVPRINAAGRMDHARTALNLMLTEDHTEAQNLAAILSRYNSERQRIEARIFKEALELAEHEGDSPIIILVGPGWKKGVIGIVAAKLMDRLKRPVILLTEEPDGSLEGSGRSTSEFDLYAILKSCEEYLEGFGGHRAAAGLRLRAENFEVFKEATISTVKSMEVSRTPGLKIHFDMSVDSLGDPGLKDVLSKLEPFGPGCEPPVLRLQNFLVKNMNIVGRNHLKLLLVPKDSLYFRPVEVLGWGMGEFYELPWGELELACTPFFNNWNGQRTLQLKLMDARYHRHEA